MSELHSTDGVVDIVLDRPRKLLFDWNATEAIEEHPKRPVFTTEQDAKTFWGKTSKRGLKLLLWGALLWDDPTITLEQAGHLVNLRNQEYVLQKLAEAMGMDPDTGKPQSAPEQTVDANSNGQGLPFDAGQTVTESIGMHS